MTNAGLKNTQCCIQGLMIRGQGQGLSSNRVVELGLTSHQTHYRSY